MHRERGLSRRRAACQSGRCRRISPSKSKPNPEAVRGSSSLLPAACARPWKGCWGIASCCCCCTLQAAPCLGSSSGGGGGGGGVVGNAGESSLQNPPRLPNLGALPLYHHPARGLGAEMQLMKVLVQIDSTELVCLMWGGGMVAGGRGERRAPSQPPLKHAGLGIWSELALLAGPLFPSAHTCAFCLSAVFPPPLSPLAAVGRIRKQRPQTGTYRCPHRPVAQER